MNIIYPYGVYGNQRVFAIGTVCERFSRHTMDELVMAVLTLGELCLGAEKCQLRECALAAAYARLDTGDASLCGSRGCRLRIG